MTQKEAIIHVLEEFGGRANLKDVYPRVIKLAVFKKDSDTKATIRATLQRHPELFRQSSGKKGSWELVSYQEEIASRDKRIKELEEENAHLKTIKTEDDFVARFVKKVKHNLKRDKKTVEEIRKLMDALGRSDADKELDEWLQGKDKKVVKQVTKKYIQKNINSQVFTGDITESEFNGGGSDNEGWKEETLSAIGDYFGLTRERASQIKEKTVKHLRDLLKSGKNNNYDSNSSNKDIAKPKNKITQKGKGHKSLRTIKDIEVGDRVILESKPCTVLEKRIKYNIVHLQVKYDDGRIDIITGGLGKFKVL